VDRAEQPLRDPDRRAACDQVAARVRRARPLDEAESPEAIRAHARAAVLPVDEVVPVADTVVVRPDPAPVGAG
jgi:hypothetical protein